MTDTVEQLSGVTDDDLTFPTEHGCAMAGGLERLLVHNAEHDRMHTGAVSTARFTARQMQESPLAHLTRDLIFQRAELVGQLLHMDDSLLDAKAPNDDWSIRRARRARPLLGEQLDDAGRVGDESASSLGLRASLATVEERAPWVVRSRFKRRSCRRPVRFWDRASPGSRSGAATRWPVCMRSLLRL